MSWQQPYKGKKPGGVVLHALRPWLLLAGVLVLALIAALVAGGESAAAPDDTENQGICVRWDISGEWQYAASMGGYGTLNFNQDPDGTFTGTYYNAATGGSGTLSGQINGQAVRFTSDAAEYFEGTLDSTGTNFTGVFPDNSTLEAKGHATCTGHLDPPAEGAAQITVWYGPYVYRRSIAAGGSLEIGQSHQEAPLLQPGVPVIRNANAVRVKIQIELFGRNLPNSLNVTDTIGGQTRIIGAVSHIRTRPNGIWVYEGSVTVEPLGPIAPGVREVHTIIVVNPRNQRSYVAGQVILNLIDPSGYIYDANTNEKLEGATVSCYVRQGGRWILWDAGQYLQGNPLVSDNDGHYGWEVPEGLYKVIATRHCYKDVESSELTIPPPRTDVHLGMQPLGCATVTITDLWTSDDNSFAATNFQAGQALEYHAVVGNSGTGDKELAINWTTTGPDGMLVTALSGSDAYIIQPGDALDIKIDGKLPAGAPGGTYKVTVQLTDAQQTSLKITTFAVIPALHLPVILHTYEGSTPPPPPQQGIYGTITDSNQPAANVPLAMQRWNGEKVETVGQTTTNSAGDYRFSGLPSLDEGAVYYVTYGLNTSDPSRLFIYFGPDITSYNSGSNVPGGNFDIANVELLAPADDANVSLPFSFQWQQRGVPGDGYAVEIYDPAGDDIWFTDNLGDVASLPVSVLPDGMVAGTPYVWYMVVYGGPDDWGISFNEHTFTVNAGAAGLTVDHQDALWQTGSPRHRLQK